jgi:hypothetical protein
LGSASPSVAARRLPDPTGSQTRAEAKALNERNQAGPTITCSRHGTVREIAIARLSFCVSTWRRLASLRTTGDHNPRIGPWRLHSTSGLTLIPLVQTPLLRHAFNLRGDSRRYRKEIRTILEAPRWRLRFVVWLDQLLRATFLDW